METRPREKSFWMPGFILQMTRGLIRSQHTRRRAMFVLIVGAMLMLFAGFTFLRGALDPHAYALRFMLYWLACAWLTFTALMLALLDALMTRRQARTERERLRENFRPAQPNE